MPGKRLVFIHAPDALVAAFIFKIRLDKQQAALGLAHTQKKTTRESITALNATFDGFERE